MPTTTKPRFLVKTRAGRVLPAAGFQFEKISFRSEPLFSRPAEAGGFAAAAAVEQWHVVEATEDLGQEQHPWDAAYRALDKGLGLAADDAPTIIEPDLPQQWTYTNRSLLTGGEGLIGAAEICQFNDQDTHGGQTPAGPEFGWFLRPDFSQLRAAREEVGDGRRRALVAHIDTGYDPRHVTLPEHLRLDLQRNFVEGEDPNDASDPAHRGLLRNPGHGTGTLSILAGNRLLGVPNAGPLLNLPLGGAPKAGVIPLRVAKSVVLFYSSAVARAFEYATTAGADVVSMSMGGLASSAWTDAVNRAYEAGVIMVCAAGNNFGGVPTRHIVYPARYKRVIAACGVMGDDRPYNGLPIWVMQGNWGPPQKMQTALSAYTPNIPWAEIQCGKIVDMNGEGTSAATPQIAAAAALWLMKHDPRYPQGWMKVEAARKALFDSARPTSSPERLGRGILKARDALALQPAAAAQLSETPPDSASFPFLRVLTGLGIARNVRAAMFELEAAQLLQTSKTLEDILETNGVDPDQRPQNVRPKVRQQFVEAMAAEPACSRSLREHLEQQFVTQVRPQIAVGVAATASPVNAPEPPDPTTRSLRAYAFDPSLGLALETAVLNKVTAEVPWEGLQPGPVGKYIEVVDIDPASGCAYAPVDLNDPRILAQDGLEPSEGNPQFHQQMVYAVAMKTIKNFEKALGRAALWSARKTHSREPDGGSSYREDFVRRLRIYPHALREANAYYSPERKALLFGYFPASWTNPGKNLPGGVVFTCLSHDIVAHETTHALLDGLHPRFAERSNPDVLAFHEAFADIVALFQHFSFPEALRHQIEKTRGDLAKQNLLGELAQQFGEAIGNYGALRDAIGRVNDKTKQWEPLEPDAEAYQHTVEPHARGAILVAAIFDAFLAIYKRRIRDLMRIASGGSGILPEGDIHPDLVNRFAEEASTAAKHVCTICIRALDYCPPVDVTFGEYLRALITADADLVPDDQLGYRIAFMEAFRRRGIFPEHVRTLSVDSLRWRGPEQFESLPGFEQLLANLNLSWNLGTDRRRAYQESKQDCFLFWKWVQEQLKPLGETRKYSDEMGLAWGDTAPSTIRRNRKGDVALEVHSVRPARRVAPDGSFITEIVVEMTQQRIELRDEKNPGLGTFQFRGGCTLLIDPITKRIRYCIRKDILSKRRLERQRRFEVNPSEISLYATYFGDPRRNGEETFALLHRNH